LSICKILPSHAPDIAVSSVSGSVCSFVISWWSPGQCEH
jgi:hypothetical protein